MIIDTPNGRVAIDTLHQFFYYQKTHPAELSGLVLETLIRELVSTSATPIYYKQQQLDNSLKNIREDHTVYADKYYEFDKRLHTVVEYVREKCDDKNVLKQEDLYKLQIEVDDRVIKMETQMGKMKTLLDSLQER